MKKNLIRTKENVHLRNMKKEKIIFGYILLLPFILGFVFFFLQPLLLSLVYSFSNVDLMNKKLLFDYVGFTHYFRALAIEIGFRDKLIFELRHLVSTAPMIVIFSLFIATLLNKKFKGRMFARVILFLPVIITTGVMLSIESSDYLLGTVSDAIVNGGNSQDASGTFEIELFSIQNIVLNMKLPSQIMILLNSILDNFYNILISSGVQITILLASIQSIPHSLYEASSIEGATAWENFWLITIPMISPYLFVCTFYTIIDSFGSPLNSVVNIIKDTSSKLLDYGYASAMAWIYFAITAAILILVALGFNLSKTVFYYNK